eukprot:m.3741 g.3741  ORF g.3741 m.3741 type:complete len:550 (+) comp9745_c0_seq2:2-1651(+)
MRGYWFVVILLFASIFCNLLLLLEKVQVASLHPCNELKATGYRVSKMAENEQARPLSSKQRSLVSRKTGDSFTQAIHYHNNGPTPPIMLVRPLCFPQECAEGAGQELKTIYARHGIFVTEKESDPWRVLIGNPYKGLPKLTRMWQKSNVIPGLLNVCLPERLCRLYRDVARRFGASWEAWRFMPRCFVLPEDGDAFKMAATSGSSDWLWRRAGSKRGKGGKARIFGGVKSYGDMMALGLNESQPEAKSDELPFGLVEEYITKPLLVNKRKHTLKLYALIQSFDPLEMYLYERGEVLFANQPYEDGAEHLNSTCMHFDMSSSPRASNCSKGYDNVSLYWGLEHYWAELQNAHIVKTPDFLWLRIKEVATQAGLFIASTVLSHWRKTYSKDKLPGKAYWKNGFSLIGIDVVIDEMKQPWIVDIDCGPGFSHLGTKSEPLKAKLLKNMVESYLKLNGYFAEKFSRASYRDLFSAQFDSFCSSRGGCTEEEGRRIVSHEDSVHSRSKFSLLFPRVETVGKYAKTWRATMPDNSDILVQWALHRRNRKATSKPN